MNPLTLALRECLSKLEDERDPLPPQIITRPAIGASTPACVGIVPVSVFQLAERQPVTIRVSSDTIGQRVAHIEAPQHGVKRVHGACYPERETALDVEREQKRRARQTPPTPSFACRKANNKMMDQPVI